MQFWVLSALVAVASSAQIVTYTNSAARANQLIAGRGALPVRVSDTAIHPVNYWNAGLQAAGLPYELVGHSNGAVVPAESVAVAGARATHLAVVQAIEDAEAEALAIHLAAVQAKKDAEARELAAHFAQFQAIKDAHAGARAAHFAAVKAAKAQAYSSSGTIMSTEPIGVTYNNGAVQAARATHLVAGKGALPVGASDTAIHPVNYWNAGLQAAGLSYELVGHSNGAVVPAEPIVQPLSHSAVVQAVEDAAAEALAIQLAAVQAKKDAKARERAAHLAKIQAIKDAHAEARAAHFAAVKSATGGAIH